MRERRPKIREVVRKLEREYGSPRHGNKSNPLDELIYIILSTRTQPGVYSRNYANLKKMYPSWNLVQPRDVRRVASAIRSNGLARVKAKQIVGIVSHLKKAHGRATLAPLRFLSDTEAEALLTSLPGVSLKVAKCVLMYSLSRDVLPVDVHAHRLASRLGMAVKKRPDSSQHLIESAVPPKHRYSFHVNAIAHGRARCFEVAPLCNGCPIRSSCDWVHEAVEEECV